MRNASLKLLPALMIAGSLAAGCGPLWKYQPNYGMYSVWDSGDIGTESGEKVAVPDAVLEYVLSNPPSPVLYYYGQALEMQKAPPDSSSWQWIANDLNHMAGTAGGMGGDAKAYARSMAKETAMPINKAITAEGYAKIFWGWKAEKDGEGAWDMKVINANYLMYLYHNAADKKVTLILWDISSEVGRVEYDLSGVAEGADYDAVAGSIKQAKNTFGAS